MSGTLANNITKEIQAPHAYEIFLSDAPDQEGDAMQDTYAAFHIVVSRLANKIAYAKILIQDGSVASQDFPISNEDDFAPGKYITVKMGDVNGVEPIFKGVIIKHGIKIRQNKKSVLTLDCRDVAIKTTTLCKNKYFSEKTTDSDAIKAILDEYNSGATVIDSALEDVDVEHEGLVQYNCTDWDFILKRANAAGQLVFTDKGVLTTITPSVGDSADHTLAYGDEILEFEAEMDARNQFKEVVLNVWDSSKQEVIEEELSKLDAKLDKPGDLSTDDLSEVTNADGLEINYPGQLVDGDIKNLVKAELTKSKLARIRGRVSYKQATVVHPMSTIELKGVGNRFNGLTYVTGTRHEFSKNVWKTDIQFGLDRDWFEKSNRKEDAAIEDRIPAMSGLHIGVVTKLDDESGEDRVKVRVPIIDAEGEGIWAKMSRPDAGEHRGLFYLPELDDEVLVGFLNCDPRYPMIVGMLNSSAKPAPVEGKAEDNLKGYYSKEGSRIEFDDKKRTLKVQTMHSGESGSLADFRTGEPELEKNNTILLDDENGTILIQDKNKNFIQLSKDEITIFGDKKITLESKEIMIKATNKLVTDTKKSELVSSGETKIKGSVINLNP